ncbi:MAG: hypothetical protein RLZZ301_1473 [Bacteroidota bacterium]|jgi:predicted amidohydrolase
MQDLTVAILQFDQVWEDKQANFEKIQSFLRQASSIDLLLLPEMFQTGFSMNIALAESMENSESILFLTKVAHEKQCAIYTSFIVQDQGNYFNRGLFLYPDGTSYYYDKRQSFGLGGEDRVFQAGTTEMIVSYLGWKFNLQICYDLRFPELIRNRIEGQDAAYDVLLYVANWPSKRIQHWDALVMARAIENQSYVLACNRVGTDGMQLAYNGHSQVLTMFGEQLGFLDQNEGLLQVKLSANALQMGREQLPFLKDRK